MYINPFQLLSWNDLKEMPDRAEIRKRKKKLILEIDLDGGDYSFQGQKLNKSDVQHLLDQLDDEQTAAFHLKLAQHKGLSDFLSKGKLPTPQTVWPADWAQDPELLAFISPYFAERYGDLMFKAYQSQAEVVAVKGLPVIKTVRNKYQHYKYKKAQKKIIQKIEQLSTMPLLATPADQTEGLKRIYDDIQNKLGQLEQLLIAYRSRGIPNMSGVINYHQLLALFYPPLLEALPEHFQELREQLQRTIVNFCRVLNNRDMEYDASQQLMIHYGVLKVSVHDQEQYRDVRRIIDGNVRIQNNKTIQEQKNNILNNLEGQLVHTNYTVCWFCDKASTEDFYRVPVLKKQSISDNARLVAGLQNSMHLQAKEDIGVKYCTHCEKKHLNGKRLFWVAFVITVLTLLHNQLYYIILVPLLAFLVGKCAEFAYMKMVGVQPKTKRSLKNHPVIKEKVEDGYTLMWLKN